MDLSKMQNDFMKEMFNIQEKGIEMWKEGIEKAKDMYPTNTFNAGQFMNPMSSYEKWTKLQKDLMPMSGDNPMDILNKYIKSNQEIFMNFTKSAESNQVKDVFNKMAESMSSYTNLFKFWQDLQGQVGGNKEQFSIKEFVDKWKDKYLNILSETVLAEIPSNITDLTKEPMRLFKVFCDYNVNFMEPLGVNSKEYLEKNPFLNKEYMKAYESYVTTLEEFFKMFREKTLKTMEEIVLDYQNMIKEGTFPKTFKEFYDYWFDKNNKVVSNILETEEFSKLLAKLSQESLNYKKSHDVVMEKQLEWMPFPLKSEMKSLYKTVHDLNKEVKSLKKQISEMKKGDK